MKISMNGKIYTREMEDFLKLLLLSAFRAALPEVDFWRCAITTAAPRRDVGTQ
jgi:hypothetical protein